MKNKMAFSSRLKQLLVKLEKRNNYVAFELSSLSETTLEYDNVMEITMLDISDSDFSFDAIINGRREYVKIGTFLRAYFPGAFSEKDINEFNNAVNDIKFEDSDKGSKIVSKGISKSSKPYSSPKHIVPAGNPVEHMPFKFNPKDVRSTFLSMVTKTYPHFSDKRHEKEVLQFLPSLKEDQFGNYYKVIGNSDTMFTSHLDTADSIQKETVLLSRMEGGDEIIFTDGNSILGADDKAGVTVMLYMMAHNIPGLYYFFYGEERGGLGSRELSASFDSIGHVKGIKKCVSFDRRKTISVITSQFGEVCCSNDFGNALCKEYNKGGLSLSIDDTGVFTDSASLMDNIEECTNISVGYLNEHTGKEFQNISYLERLCKASLSVNWSSLPIVRKVGVSTELLEKYKEVIAEIKAGIFFLDVKITGSSTNEDVIYIRVNTEEFSSSSTVSNIKDTLEEIQGILDSYGIEPYVVFDDAYIKIELK